VQTSLSTSLSLFYSKIRFKLSRNQESSNDRTIFNPTLSFSGTNGFENQGKGHVDACQIIRYTLNVLGQPQSLPCQLSFSSLTFTLFQKS